VARQRQKALASLILRPDLTFWWQGIGRRRGLWNPGSEPTDCSTLWMDIEAALGDEVMWQATNSAVSPSFSNGTTSEFLPSLFLGNANASRSGVLVYKRGRMANPLPDYRASRANTTEQEITIHSSLPSKMTSRRKCYASDSMQTLMRLANSAT
jgi:hypothetical protein